jgi:RNA polymerase sigma factor (sigma-70 family)
MGRTQTPRLVRRAQAGDLDAYGELVDRFRDAVFGLCYHRCEHFETARDLTQDAFLRAYEHLDQLADPARFPGWLRRIAERICIDWRRRQRGEQPLEAAAQTATAGPDEIADLRLTIARALSALPQAQRLAITLYHIDGYTYREIAEFLSTRETTVKARLDAARANLRGALAELFRDALRAQRPGDEFGKEVIMRVTQIQMKQGIDHDTGGPAAHLVLGDDERAIAMQIGDAEARFLRAALERWQPPRPMTYDLMLDTWAAFGIRLTGVRIADLRDDIYFAEIDLTRGKTVKRIDCRSSDAVNLALRADVPVEVEEALMDRVAISAVQAQLDYGNLPDYPAQQADLPPLHRAAAQGDTQEAEQLLARGEEPDQPNRHGVTPLRVAAMRGHTEIANLLIGKGADVDGRDDEGRAHLHMASHFGRKGVAGALLNRGCNVNARDNRGATPLHVVSGPGMIELLLASSADLNARDERGRTPLHYAASNSRTEVVQALLAAGADATAKDRDGATALSLAASSQIADLLREHGATE